MDTTSTEVPDHRNISFHIHLAIAEGLGNDAVTNVSGRTLASGLIRAPSNRLGTVSSGLIRIIAAMIVMTEMAVNHQSSLFGLLKAKATP